MDHAQFAALADRVDGQWYRLSTQEKLAGLYHMKECIEPVCQSTLNWLGTVAGNLATMDDDVRDIIPEPATQEVCGIYYAGCEERARARRSHLKA